MTSFVFVQIVSMLLFFIFFVVFFNDYFPLSLLYFCACMLILMSNRHILPLSSRLNERCDIHYKFLLFLYFLFDCCYFVAFVLLFWFGLFGWCLCIFSSSILII